MSHPTHTATNGILGMIGSLFGLIVSAIPYVETGLRLASLVVGIAVGVLTIRNLLRGPKQ